MPFALNRTFPLMMLALAAILAFAPGCALKSRERTLAPSIRTVTVPMIVNRSAEPGIADSATRATQREFLADGRLSLVDENRADAVVEITIHGFEAEPIAFDSDDFPRQIRYTVNANVRVVQNIPGRPVYGGARRVRAIHVFTNDKRRITFEPEAEGRQRVLDKLARHIVREVLTGEFTDET